MGADMRWFRFSDLWTPLVFSPKVTPDPTSAERLDEKFEQAIGKFKGAIKPAAERPSLPDE
jgi:hypothetical protein